MAAQQPWVILRRRLGLVRPDAVPEYPAAISTALRAPPRVTLFSVDAGIVRPGRPIRSDEHPYLVATAPSALLLCFFAGSLPMDTDELILAREFVAPASAADASRQPTTGSTDLVPARSGPSMPATYNIRSVGLAPCPLGGFVITELQVARGNSRGKLSRIISGHHLWSDPGRLFAGGSRRWFETVVDYPLAAVEREWSPSGVVAHANKLWWFDLSWGLLSCNPNELFHPVMRFHDLPPGCYIDEPQPFLHTIRCICISEDLLRYVGTARDVHPADGLVGEKKVVMWTWIPEHPGAMDDASVGWTWHKSYETDFKDIWNHPSYQATGLPALVPQIVLVSPRNHNLVYFFLNKALFGVHMPLRQVVHFVPECEKLDAPVSRHCVLPWDLPSSIVNGLLQDTAPTPLQGSSPSTSQGTRGHSQKKKKGRRG